VIPFGVRDVAAATGATPRVEAAVAPLTSVSTDTRTLREGALFVALSGPSFDGTRFAPAAARAGARAVLLDATSEHLERALAELPAGVAALVHPRPRRALGDLAAWYRARLHIPVLGITGSCGKTTTKDMLLELVGAVRRVAGSPESYNNDIGVPLTVLSAESDSDVLVVELGTNGPGEIAGLCRVARPTAGVITMVGASHLEGLGSIEGVAREKGALVASLPSDGFAVLNAACPHSLAMREGFSGRVLTFGLEREADLTASQLLFHAAGTSFVLEGRQVTSPLLGQHNLQNLLAALAACRGLGIELDEVLPHIAGLRGVRGRLERKVVGGLTVIDDSYNSNPESARASVRVLAGLHGHARRVLVLGDMLELGERAGELHHEVGRHAAHSAPDALFLVGELSRATAAGALEAGYDPARIHHHEDLDSALQHVPGMLGDGDAVLVKGSRGVRLDRLVRAIEERFGACAGGPA
jgi:UDP-N-acetylmuramoyl-tripeptide--D-alanyl-D-alanine ligase